MHVNTQRYLDAWLLEDSRDYAWNVCTLSRCEREEIATDLWSYQSQRWQREKRYLLERQREDRLWTEHLRMEKLLQEEQERENQKLNREYWARQEALELQQQQELRQRKQKELLDKKLRKQLELRQEQRELVENKKILHCLKINNPQKPEPPKYSRPTAPAPRAPRKVLPFTGRLPKVL